MSELTTLAARLQAVKHYECEDCFYSCPESDEGCCDERQTGCTCHAGLMHEAAAALLAAADLAERVERVVTEGNKLAAFHDARCDVDHYCLYTERWNDAVAALTREDNDG